MIQREELSREQQKRPWTKTKNETQIVLVQIIFVYVMLLNTSLEGASAKSLKV